MDQIGSRLPHRLMKTLRQFRYPALILLLGLVLILWPGRKAQVPAAEPAAPVSAAPETRSVESRMEEILSCIDGAGEVRVLLTERTGDETVYQTDESESHSEGGENRSATTVIVRGSGGDAPVVRQTLYGEYRGALIVCTGADSPQVRLSLVNAVSGLTGLSTDRITVIKMKQ